MDVNSRVLEPRGLEKVAKLIERGVRIPNPLTIDIDEAVDIDNISSDGVVIGPGCRIRWLPARQHRPDHQGRSDDGRAAPRAAHRRKGRLSSYLRRE